MTLHRHSYVRNLLAVTVWILLAHSSLIVSGVRAAPIAPSLSAVIKPDMLIPGQAGFVRVVGGYPLQVEISLDDQPLPATWTGESYMTVFAFDFDEPPGEHIIMITAYDLTTRETLTLSRRIIVIPYEYPLEDVTLSADLSHLLDPDINLNELQLLQATYSMSTGSGGFEEPFMLPVPDGVVTSNFGGERSYNGGIWNSHHTGVDFRRAVGEPVLASAPGHVVLAEPLLVRGNVVIIDHGNNVFSQYAHLSEIYVQVGEHVRTGGLIGTAGITGRINGPHLHFEIVVNGIPVDPIRWMALSPAFVPPREAVRGPND